jgi:two-component system cell cycle sensor histidine kinase/response regulator CckA
LTDRGARPNVSSMGGAMHAWGGVVMVVEDDPDLRGAVVDRLCHDGHLVHEAESVDDALAALEALRRHGRAIDIMLIDVCMPGRSGLELVAELRRMRSTASPIVMTGFADGAVQGDLDRLGVEVLHKPFAFEALREAIAAALVAREPVHAARSA